MSIGDAVDQQDPRYFADGIPRTGLSGVSRDAIAVALTQQEGPPVRQSTRKVYAL
jgi:hypothetical protein